MCYIELEQKLSPCKLQQFYLRFGTTSTGMESIDKLNTFNCFLPAELGSDLLYNLDVKLSVLQISENF